MKCNWSSGCYNFELALRFQWLSISNSTHLLRPRDWSYFKSGLYHCTCSSRTGSVSCNAHTHTIIIISIVIIFIIIKYCLQLLISLSVTESFSNCFLNHTCGKGSALRVHLLCIVIYTHVLLYMYSHIYTHMCYCICMTSHIYKHVLL